MVSWGKVTRTVAVGMGAAALVAACGSDGGEEPVNGSEGAAGSPAIAPDVPAGFDACKDIPQSLLESEQLVKPHVDTKDGNGGVKWRGCRWIQSDGYSATIDTTNITPAMVRANHEFTISEELAVGGRPTVTYHASDEQKDPRSNCLLSVEMKGGSLEITVVNPQNRKKSGGQDSCEIAKRLANGIVSAIPAAS